MMENALTRIHIEDVGQAYCVGRLDDFIDEHIASFLGTRTQVYLGACTQTTEPLTLTSTPSCVWPFNRSLSQVIRTRQTLAQ
ncbi:hypothetical protein ALP99_200030 [Pseudomonas syringae pv. tomato]|nr:hypothetical protein ALP99_200030 [Pseudomonas syringae pv. tomato]